MIQRHLLRACVRLAQDPNRTHEIFEVSRALVSSPATRAMASRIFACAETRGLIESRYRPKAIALRPEDYAPGTLGRAYSEHMVALNLDPNFYEPLPADSDLNYLRLRIRETHDLWHVVLGFKTDKPGETGLSAAYAAQMGQPALALGVGLLLIHAVLFDFERLDDYFSELARGWQIGKKAKPLLAWRWEDCLHRDLGEIREELGVAN